MLKKRDDKSHNKQLNQLKRMTAFADNYDLPVTHPKPSDRKIFVLKMDIWSVNFALKFLKMKLMPKNTPEQERTYFMSKLFL